VEPTLGKEFKEYVEKRLAVLEEGGMRSGAKGVSRPTAGKFEKKAEGTKSGTAQYSKEADAVEEAAPKKKKREATAEDEEEVPKKKKKKVATEEDEEAPAEKKKKKKKAEE